MDKMLNTALKISSCSINVHNISSSYCCHFPRAMLDVGNTKEITWAKCLFSHNGLSSHSVPSWGIALCCRAG